MERIALVGGGLIGQAWAIVFGRAGHEVMLYDAEPAAAEAGAGCHRGAACGSRKLPAGRRPSCHSRAHRLRHGARRGAGRRRPRPGERARAGRGEARAVRRARPAGRAGCDSRELDLGHSGVRLHRARRRAPSLPGGASDQPAVRDAAGRAVPGAVDRSRRGRSHPRPHDPGRPGADPAEQGGPGLRRQPHAGGAARRGAAHGRGRRRLGRRHRYRDQARHRPALVVHGAARDHRPERAGRHRDYLRRYGPLYQAIEREHGPLEWTADACCARSTRSGAPSCRARVWPSAPGAIAA